MSSRTYLCPRCGSLRRASAVYRQKKKTAEQVVASVGWPKHCGAPMQVLSYEQGVAASQMEDRARVTWAVLGLHVLQRGGKRKWRPALNARQAEAARQQHTEFLARRAQL